MVVFCFVVIDGGGSSGLRWERVEVMEVGKLVDASPGASPV
jgi:hypothetical protein